MGAGFAPGAGRVGRRGPRVTAGPLQTIRAVQPDVVVVELCQYRVSMLKMDERTLLREAKEISLEKLQQAVRQVGPPSPSREPKAPVTGPGRPGLQSVQLCLAHPGP